MAVVEKDLRLSLLNTLLTTPHRRLDEVWLVHDDLVKQDPRFYVRLAAWYSDHGDVRDHKEVFAITLALSAFEGHRDVGLALLRQMPPYQVVRVLDFIHGRKKARPTQGDAQAPAEVETFGLSRNVPRSLRTEVVRYLREREADPAWFDATALSARKALKRMYALLHVRPGERAQKVLFDRDPPADSRLAALKALAQATSPEEQARTIRAERLPYRVAASVLTKMTPAVVRALVEVMSPAEVINSLGALKRRGALADPAVKALVDEKLVAARSAKRVSAFKAAEAVKAVALPDDVRTKLEEVADAQVLTRGRVERPTALLIDKSGSMQAAIELGKRLGATISAVCARELYVYAFDTLAYPVTPAGSDLTGWEKAMAGLTAGGGTSVGIAVETLRKKRQYVEQIVVVSDEGENEAPRFVEAVKKYRDEVKADVSVVFVKTPGATCQLEEECRQAGIAADAYQFDGDYYSLPNLIPLLARPSKRELLMEILEYPLPTRRAS